MVFDGISIFAYILGLITLYILCRVFIKPLRLIFKLLLNSLFGGLILAAVNFIGGFAGILININPLTSAFAGVLGVPGVILCALLQYAM